MGIGDRRYSEAQIAAVIWTCLDGPRRVSVPEAMRHATAGTLTGPDGKRLDPFEGNVGTFRDYVAREGRKRRRAETIAAGGRNAGAILAARLVDVGEREVRRLEVRAQRGAKNKPTAGEIRECAAMLRELVKLSREAGLPDPRPDEPAPGDTTGNGNTAGTLAAEITGAAPASPRPIV